MSTYADWQHLERAMRAGVVSAALPARARVWMAVQLMEAEGVEAIGPSLIAERCGLPLRTTNNHLKTLRDELALTSNAGNYASAENRHAENRHDSNAENRHSVPETGTIDGVPKTGTIAVPKTGTRTIYKRSRSTTTAEAVGETPESRASSFPTFGDTTAAYPEGFAEVIEAWVSLKNPSGMTYATQVGAATRSVLQSITEEHGATLTLQGIASIEASHNTYRAPMPHWVRDRIAGIKAGANRPNSQARKTRGGGDELIGSITPEQRAEARAQTVDPDKLKRLLDARKARMAALRGQMEGKA